MLAYVTSIGEKTTQICCDQLIKYGFDVVNNHLIIFHRDFMKGKMVKCLDLRKEMDELWDGIKRNDARNMKEEIRQVAAMAIRFYVDVVD